MAVLGLRFYTRAFSSCGKQGPLFIAVRGPLTIAASPAAEHRLQTRRLSSCGSRAQFLCGMWDLPRPGLEPMSPALAGGFSTTAPPGKPTKQVLLISPFYKRGNQGTEGLSNLPKVMQVVRGRGGIPILLCSQLLQYALNCVPSFLPFLQNTFD